MKQLLVLLLLLALPLRGFASVTDAICSSHHGQAAGHQSAGKRHGYHGSHGGKVAHVHMKKVQMYLDKRPYMQPGERSVKTHQASCSSCTVSCSAAFAPPTQDLLPPVPTESAAIEFLDLILVSVVLDEDMRPPRHAR